MVLARKERVWWFAGTAATVYTAVFCMARAHAHAANAGGVGLGAACDLTITVPVLFYLLLVRPGFSSWITLVAMVIGGDALRRFCCPRRSNASAAAALAGHTAGDLGAGGIAGIYSLAVVAFSADLTKGQGSFNTLVGLLGMAVAIGGDAIG